MPTIKRAPRPSRKETICLFALFLLPGLLTGQNTQNREAAGPELAASAQGVFYSSGQLRINVENSTLAEVLMRVAALTGAHIEIPEGASAEQIPSLQLGPGPARQTVASLLSDSNFDYLIQGFDADPDKLQNVLLLPRGKKDNIPDVPARLGRSPYARAAAPPAPPEDAPPPDAPPATQDQAVASSLSIPAQSDPAAAGAPPPDLSAPPVFGQPLQTNVPKTFPVPPPATLDQQSINQQLQQMYQQRMQMVQQEHPGASPPLPVNR